MDMFSFIVLKFTRQTYSHKNGLFGFVQWEATLYQILKLMIKKCDFVKLLSVYVVGVRTFLFNFDRAPSMRRCRPIRRSASEQRGRVLTPELTVLHR